MTSGVGPDVGAKVVRAATGVLAEKGFHGFTISAVARAAGVSRPTVYAHFGTREQLVAEVLMAVAAEVVQRVVEQTRGAATAADFVVETMVALRGEFRRQPALEPLAFPQRGSVVFDGDALGPQSMALARGFLRPLLDFHPELADELDEITETSIRFLLSLVMFESELSASDEQLRGFLHRRLVPALGLPSPPPTD
jgi:AcrR family transcriptional regulator